MIAAIKRLSVGGGTSLGQGLYTSLSAIAGKPLKIDEAALERDDGAVNIGFFGSSAIVLLSDGENTSRLDPLRLAEVASTAGVRIHAIGVGTEEGTVVEIDGFSIATALDEDLLEEIAKVTDGTYEQAGDAEALTGIYESIDLEFKRVEEPREVTALFAAARRAPPRARLGALDRVVRAGDLTCRSHGRSRCCRWSSPPRSSVRTGGCCAGGGSRPFATRASRCCARCCRERNRWQRHLPVALLLASLVALAFAAGRPHVERRRPVRAHVGHPRPRRLGVDVLDRRRAQPAGRRAGGGSRVRREPAEGRPDGPRRLLGLRGAERSADDRPRGARRRDRVAHDRAWHRHRRGDAEGDRRHRRGEPERAPGRRRSRDRPPPAATAAPGANGYVPDIVVLLTDGASNRGIEPLDAVPYAVERGVRVFTIGFGTENPAPPSCTREQLGGDVFDPDGSAAAAAAAASAAGSAAGGGFRRRADLPTLQAVAKQTGGTYHDAEDADQLREVFADLPKDVATQKQPTEITWILAALGALLAAAAIAASMRWSPYP